MASWCVTEPFDAVETGEPVRLDESTMPEQTSVTLHQGSISKRMHLSLAMVLILAAFNWATQLLETADLTTPTVL